MKDIRTIEMEIENMSEKCRSIIYNGALNKLNKDGWTETKDKVLIRIKEDDSQELLVLHDNGEYEYVEIV